MKVLLVGGGGREHALAWRLKHDDPAIQLYAAPGNPGIAQVATCLNAGVLDIGALLALAHSLAVDFTLIGPEAPLEAGMVNRFHADGLAAFGPTREAARIETSKAFAKQVMGEAGVPTARAVTCTDAWSAKAAAREFGAPVVVKASGLAAGKGVMVCESLDEADRAIDAMLVGHAFGAAGNEVLVEEFMSGEELSVFGITDGTRVLALPAAQDHKRLLDGDRGPNTGGMGAYAPVSLATKDLMERVTREIVEPTLAALAARGCPFTGLLYAGLMVTATGPRVVEFNCRFGDPETQALLPMLELGLPFGEILAGVARGESLPASVTVATGGAAVTTVLAAEGYPDKPVTGGAITIPTDLGDDVLVFQAGTRRDASGQLVTSGGRVLGVTARAPDLREAARRSRAAAGRIEFGGKQYRSDIGWRELSRNA